MKNINFKQLKSIQSTLLKLVMITTIVAATVTAYGQRRNSFQYISADLGGGLQSIQYSPIDGTHKMGAGMTFNVGYRYFFANNWAVYGGLGISTYGAKTKYNSSKTDSVPTYEFTQSYDSVNLLDYEFRTYFNGFEEKQNAVMLEIPIKAYYEYVIPQTRFEVFGAAGFKIGIPVSSKYKLLKGSYETRGYYPFLGHEIKSPNDSVYIHGFGTYEADKQSGKMTLSSINLSLVLEGGANYRFNKMLRISASLYFGYCLTNIHKDTTKPLLAEVKKDGTSDPEYKYNGTLQSNRIDHASLLSFGVKAGVVMDLQELLGKKSHRKY